MANNIDILKLFKNRQVIVNHYVNDELISKDGYLIDYVEINKTNITFIKNEQTVYSIDLNEFPDFTVMDDFSNYFSFIKGNSRIEIYFP